MLVLWMSRFGPRSHLSPTCSIPLTATVRRRCIAELRLVAMANHIGTATVNVGNALSNPLVDIEIKLTGQSQNASS